MFISPKCAADDGINGIENEAWKKYEQDRHAARIGKKKIESVVSEKQNAEYGDRKTKSAYKCSCHDGLLCRDVIFSAVFCDESGNCERNTGSGGGGEYGKYRKGDLVDPHAFRSESTGKYDAVNKSECFFCNGKNGNISRCSV